MYICKLVTEKICLALDIMAIFVLLINQENYKYVRSYSPFSFVALHHITLCIVLVLATYTDNYRSKVVLANKETY